MLSTQNALLTVVDVQGKLARIVQDSEAVIKNIGRMIRGADLLDLPILWLEQNPQGLGPTVPELSDLLDGRTPIHKMSFSCCGNLNYMQALRDSGRKQILLAGIEAHICVYQTAAQLIKQDYEVHIVADAVSSRSQFNRELALDKLQRAGAELTCVEMALYEMQQIAEGQRFKDLIKIVK